MPSTHVGAVTGANKGIGLAIVRNLALQYPSSFLKSQGAIPSSSLLIYLTARDKTRGEEAVRLIYDDAELRRRKVLRNHDGEGEGQGGVTVKFHQLDISDEGSIEGFEAFLRSEHPDGIDFLVNNAAIAMNGFGGSAISLIDMFCMISFKGVADLCKTTPWSAKLSTATTTAPSP